MFEALEDCLTCRRKTDNFFRISDENDGEEIGTVVAHHFWFQVDQYGDRVLCTSCWEKIDGFHKFYCEVKQIWDHETLLPISASAIKREHFSNEDDELPYAAELVKVEVSQEEKDEGLAKSVDRKPRRPKKRAEVPMTTGQDREKDEPTDDDSEEDSTLPIAKRRRSAKVKESASPRKKRKSSSKSSKFVPRIKEERALTFKCEICDDPARAYKTEDGLQLHKMVFHSADLEKVFQCGQCEKAFAYEWQLCAHMKWHKKESMNIHCDKCNRYFHSIRTLNNHVRANHPDIVDESHQPISLVTTAVNGILDLLPNEDPVIPENSSQMPPDTEVPSEEKKTALTSEDHEERDALIRKFCTLSCDKCEFVGEEFKQLKIHYKRKHKLSGYGTCCGKRFYKKCQLFDHCQGHLNPDMFRCEICQKSFKEREGLDRHKVWVHTPDSEKPFKCDICDSSFLTQHMLLPHMKYHLSMEEKRYSCKDCGKCFGGPLYLRAHEQSIHGASSSWVCDICAKGFPIKSLLEMHRLTHTEEGAASLKRQCEHCTKWLTNEKHYKRHLQVCLAKGPISCDVCGKMVSTKPALTVHKRFYHSGEAPVFTCSFCGKQFRRAIRHKEHEANHRGEVLYNCDFCPYSCNSNSNMYTHKKTAHTELWAAKVAERYYKR